MVDSERVFMNAPRLWIGELPVFAVLPRIVRMMNTRSLSRVFVPKVRSMLSWSMPERILVHGVDFQSAIHLVYRLVQTLDFQLAIHLVHRLDQTLDFQSDSPMGLQLARARVLARSLAMARARALLMASPSAKAKGLLIPRC